MKKNKFPVTNIGSVSLFMVFFVLCLVTFATLSLSSAVSDYRFGEKTADHNTAYYEASNTAALRLKQVDSLLMDAYQANSADYLAEAAKSFTSDTASYGTYANEDHTLRFQIPVNDTHALEVILALHSPEQLSDGFYHITVWREVSTTKWQGDDHLNLLK